MARKHEDKSYRIYYIIIPIGILIVGFIINVIFDKYHETVLKNDTKEIISYLMTKDIETVEDYRAFAVELYKNKGYDDPENISVILGDDYLLSLLNIEFSLFSCIFYFINFIIIN